MLQLSHARVSVERSGGEDWHALEHVLQLSHARVSVERRLFGLLVLTPKGFN